MAPEADDDPGDPASSQIAPGGLDAPSPDSACSGDLMKEQALWVHERCKITRLEYRRRLGELIPVEDAKRQTAALARRIRAALDRAPSHLPADLDPATRAAATTAMAAAIRQALSAL